MSSLVNKVKDVVRGDDSDRYGNNSHRHHDTTPHAIGHHADDGYGSTTSTSTKTNTHVTRTRTPAVNDSDADTTTSPNRYTNPGTNLTSGTDSSANFARTEPPPLPGRRNQGGDYVPSTNTTTGPTGASVATGGDRVGEALTGKPTLPHTEDHTTHSTLHGTSPTSVRDDNSNNTFGTGRLNDSHDDYDRRNTLNDRPFEHRNGLTAQQRDNRESAIAGTTGAVDLAASSSIHRRAVGTANNRDSFGDNDNNGPAISTTTNDPAIRTHVASAPTGTGQGLSHSGVFNGVTGRGGGHEIDRTGQDSVSRPSARNTYDSNIPSIVPSVGPAPKAANDRRFDDDDNRFNNNDNRFNNRDSRFNNDNVTFGDDRNRLNNSRFDNNSRFGGQNNSNLDRDDDRNFGRNDNDYGRNQNAFGRHSDFGNNNYNNRNSGGAFNNNDYNDYNRNDNYNRNNTIYNHLYGGNSAQDRNFNGPKRSGTGQFRNPALGLDHHGPGYMGSKVLHECDHCGQDNDITYYFRKEAVYRLHRT